MRRIVSDISGSSCRWLLCTVLIGACQEWQAGVSSGYGTLRADGERIGAHRHSWALDPDNDPIPDGMQVLHRCDNRRCVLGTHLFVGTPKDNMQDMAAKGRAGSGPGQQNPNVRLTDAQVRDIRERFANASKRWGMQRTGTAHRRAHKRAALREWAALHFADTMVKERAQNILEPPIRAYLALIDSERNPSDLAASLVQRYLSESKALVDMAVGTETVGYEERWTMAARRWERLPTDIADRVAQDEMRQVRRRLTPPTATPAHIQKTPKMLERERWLAQVYRDLERDQIRLQNAEVDRQFAELRRRREDMRRRASGGTKRQ
jgi:hypothetical protein